jgi:hypothetical protein
MMRLKTYTDKDTRKKSIQPEFLGSLLCYHVNNDIAGKPNSIWFPLRPTAIPDHS